MKVTVAALSCGTVLSFSLNAYGQTVPVADASSSTAEVVITATKRSSTVQETPISISAVSGDDLQARGTASLAALAQGTPGVSLKSEGPWFDAYSPTTLKQYAGFGDATYALTDALKVDLGARVNHYDYRFSSCISGWGSANGAATPSCSGRIALSNNSFTPKLNLAYTFSPDLMAYATVSSGFRPGGGNAAYPTTGSAWGGAFQQQGYTSGKWPSTYEPDRVWSYELGEKGRMLDRRLTVDASIYYEDWRHVQLEAYPNDWALNINGNYVSIYGADIDTRADLGAGFQLEVAAGYLYEYLNGGPHWVIAPVHKMPDVAPESETAAISYSRALGASYILTARMENSYTGPRYSISFPNPYEFTGTYTQLPSYDLTNVRVGVQFLNTWSATLFVNNVTNKHARLESMFTENEPQPDFTRYETNQPLTAGVDLTYRF